MAQKTYLSKALTQDDLDRLLSHMEHSDSRKPNYIRDFLMILLMADAGLRVGELVQLECGDLYQAGGIVKNLIVRKRIAKNNRERTVPLSKRIIDCSRVYYRENVRMFLEEQHPLFPSRSEPDKKITTRSVQNLISFWGMSALSRHLSPHMLRHTFATRAMKVMDIRSVQELLGHINLQSTQVYTHPDLAEIGQKIDLMV